MNTISRQTKIYICALIIACMPVYSIKSDCAIIENIKKEDKKVDVWYKKRSTHLIAAAGAVTVAALYALAVYKNKMMGPIALLAALYGAEKNIEKTDNTKINPDQTADTDKNLKQPEQTSEVKPTTEPFEKADESEKVTPEESKVQTAPAAHADQIEVKDKQEGSDAQLQNPIITAKIENNDVALPTAQKQQIEENPIKQKLNEIAQFWKNIQITPSNVDQSRQEQANL